MQSPASSNTESVAWQRGVLIGGDERPTYQASPADIETFRDDGVVLLRGVFSEWANVLREGLQRNLDDPQAFAFPCESDPNGEPGRFFDSYCNWQLVPEYLDFVAHSGAASMAGQFMGGDYAQFLGSTDSVVGG